MEGGEVKNRSLRSIGSKLGLSYFLSHFWLFYNILTYITSLLVEIVLVIVYDGIKVTVSESTISEGGTASSQEYIDKIWTAWL